jgi:hypothetical protein
MLIRIFSKADQSFPILLLSVKFGHAGRCLRAVRKLWCPALVRDGLLCPPKCNEDGCEKDSLIFLPVVTFFITFLYGRQKSKKTRRPGELEDLADFLAA